MSSPNRRPARDPDAPRRNMTAFLLYQNAMRDTFKQQNPGMTFGQLAKFTSAMYSELPPGEKVAWNQRAESDKQRFMHELASYVPPPGYNAKGDSLDNATTGGSEKSSKKVSRVSSSNVNRSTRDPNAPRRNMSAYLLYQNCMREQFKQLNPGITFGQLAKYTSYMYKCLSQEEKQRWEAHSSQDKARYEAEMTTYIPPPGYDATGNLVENHRRISKKYLKKHKDPELPKRARGSFVFFTFDMRPQVMQEHPGIKFVDMGVILGKRWRELPVSEKQKYEELAHEDKQRFNREMEEYQTNRIMNEPEEESTWPVDPTIHATAHGGGGMEGMVYDSHHLQHYDHAAAAAAHHAYYADPNAAYYPSDPNMQHDDPYGQHAMYYHQGGQQYHYA